MSLVLLVVTPVYYYILGYFATIYCGHRVASARAFCGPFLRIDEYLIVLFFVLAGLGTLSILSWVALRSDRRGRILIFATLLPIPLLLWVVEQYHRSSMSLPAVFMLYTLVVLFVATAIYNTWKDKMRKIRGFFFFVVFLLLVVFAVPLPLRCAPKGEEVGIGAVGGFGADVVLPVKCYSIFSHTYWNNPTWKFTTRHDATFFFEFEEYTEYHRPGSDPVGFTIVFD